MKTNILSAAWWKAAAIRGLRTAIAIAIPYFGAVTVFGNVSWAAVGGAAALGFVASVLMSLTGLPEVTDGSVPVWLALTTRTAKTFGQAVLAGFGTAVFITDVAWPTVLQTAAIAAFASLLAALLTNLPETDGDSTGVTLPVVPTVAPVPAPVATDPIITGAANTGVLPNSGV